MEWSTLYHIPDNICLSHPQKGLGGVACGFNSLCSIGTDRRPRCDCPLGKMLDEKFKGKKTKKLSPYQAVPGVNIRSFSYNGLEEATNGFEEELGTGAFSTVYKAVLNDENGKIVAVKKLHKMLICCRKSYEEDMANENEMILAEWACDCYRRKELHLLAGDDEEAIECIEGFEKLLMVAIWCIQESPALRPNMKNVMLMLEGSVEVSVPPDPFCCSV
ncbi:hypothetical protein RND71_037366 [Anisodus tanguticus]|uniref:Protein kinase domain-containing protein n=1 Tax=Anisodus tanguticus TaxID=243964 RepID=A0AAE1UUZ0_9SOLA|nr:hypothetical protein RND71_037366 [Anisodus tanguticus]